MIRKCMLILVLAIGCTGAKARQMEVNFELPEFSTANYHNPYVAIWLESETENQTLMLWHLKRSEKDKWLKDIRRWWRKLGRYGEAPDAVTGATKGPGDYHKRFFVEGATQFKLFIEVVREDGGRSLLKQAIDLNDEQNEYTLAADKEIGPVVIKIGNK